MKLTFDIVGQRFGSLTVKSVFQISNSSGRIYSKCECICDCGKIKIAYRQSIKNGKIKSCGCLNKHHSISHGMSKSRIYIIWMHMKTRCNGVSKAPSDRKNYFERGIRVCDEWEKSFDNFYTDMGGSYRNDLTIERINVNLGYNKENCKWIPFSEQCKNKTNNIWVEIEGKKRLVSEWCDIYGKKRPTICNRIKRGWDPVSAIITPLDKRYPNIHKTQP